MTIIEEVEEGNKLSKLKKLRKLTVIDLNKARTQVEELIIDEKVKSYIEQSTIVSELETKLPKLNLEIKKEEMTNCNHIWIISAIKYEWNGHKNDKYKYHFCVKCGLYTSAGERMILTDLDHVMDPVLQNLGKDIRYDIICQHNLAKGIYDSIIRAYPDITDELAVKYMKATLHNIRTKKVSEEVQEKRVKRLGLRPNFNSWNARYIVSGN